MLKDYENYLIAAGRCEGTIHQRMIQLLRLERFVLDLKSVTEKDLTNFFSTELRNAKPEYRKAFRSAIRGFYAWATQMGYVDVDPAYRLPTVKIPRPLPRPVSEDALAFAYEEADVEVKAMILLGAMGGLRLSEITHLHMEDREGSYLRVLGKGSKERIVPMNATLSAALDRLEETLEFGYYFTGRMSKDAPRSISYVANKIKENLPRKYGAHSLRHRAASQAYGKTKDIRAVQELLGHSNVATTQLYTAITSDDLIAVSNATDWAPLKAKASAGGGGGIRAA